MCTEHPQNNDDLYTQKCVVDIVWLTIKNKLIVTPPLILKSIFLTPCDWDNYTFHPVSKWPHTINCSNTREVVIM